MTNWQSILAHHWPFQCCCHSTFQVQQQSFIQPWNPLRMHPITHAVDNRTVNSIMPTTDYLLQLFIVLRNLLHLKLPRHSWQSVSGYSPTSKAGPKSGNACKRMFFPPVCAYLYRGIVSHIISIKCVGSLHTHCVYVL